MAISSVADKPPGTEAAGNEEGGNEYGGLPNQVGREDDGVSMPCKLPGNAGTRRPSQAKAFA